jgi:pilus assembly protein CpaD
VTSAEWPTATTDTRRRFARILVGGVALAALTALSAGCSTTSTTEAAARDYDHRLRHPILISEEPENLNLPVGMNGPALSREIEIAVRDYVDEYRADGTGDITIQVPTGSANEVAAASTGRAVHYALVRSGVPRGHIRVAPYGVDDRSRIAPLRLSYLRVKAVVPSCGIWPDGGEADYRNAQYHDFGCVQAKNLAAMVANPADLIRPQPTSPAHGARRAKVIADYGQGNETKSNIMLIESGLGG